MLRVALQPDIVRIAGHAAALDIALRSISDSEGQVRFANPAAEELFGRSLQELTGVPLGLPVITGEKTEIDVIRPLIETPVTEMQVVKTEWEGDAAFLMALRDVSDRKKLEEQLLKAQRIETVGLLIGGVAQDFNNLLTTITGYAMFVEEALPPESLSSQDITRVLKAAARQAYRAALGFLERGARHVANP
jgi:nitrogen-specific signal transduction histidine kinase